MRTLNVKAAIIAISVVIVLASSTHLLHSFQLARHSDSLRKMAVAAWEEKPRRADEAIQSMKNYLVLKPTDYKSIKELASWFAQTGHFGAAATRLEEIGRELEKRISE